MAREHLDKDRAASTIAMVSVASTVGVGVGYPLAGYLTDVGGIRAAYAVGLALSTFAAGLFLGPFSVLGFVAGRVSPRARKRISAHGLLIVSTVVVLAAFVVLALVRGNLAGPLIAMSLLGFGVGVTGLALVIAVTSRARPVRR